MRQTIALLLLITVGTVLVLLTTEMPRFGEPGVRGRSTVVSRYTTSSLADTGATNMVTAIVLDYRGFDTLGETTVLFTAVMASLLTLMSKKDNGTR